MRPPARAAVAALLCAAALPLGGCGGKQDPAGGGTPPTEKLTVVLDGPPSADQAAIYLAAAGGAFRRAGLAVDLQVPTDPSAPLERVTAGRADLAVLSEPELFLARDRGTALVGVGALVQPSLSSLLTLASARIQAPGGLAGKRVGLSGLASDRLLLRTVLRRAGVPTDRVRTLDVGFGGARALVTGRVDALLGGWNTTGVALERARHRPTSTRVEQLGVPTASGLVLVARQQELGRRGRLVRRFVQALRQSTAALTADPSAAVAPLLAADPTADRGLLQAELRATVPLLAPPRGRPFGWQAPDAWRRYGTWLRTNGLLRRPPSEALLTNEFLPGEGVRPVEADPGQQGGQ